MTSKAHCKWHRHVHLIKRTLSQPQSPFITLASISSCPALTSVFLRTQAVYLEGNYKKPTFENEEASEHCGRRKRRQTPPEHQSVCITVCTQRLSLGAATLLSATLRALVLYTFLQSTRHMCFMCFPHFTLKSEDLVSSLGRVEGTNFCMHPAKWHHAKLRNIFFKWPPLVSLILGQFYLAQGFATI